jgi:hypothetical protein
MSSREAGIRLTLDSSSFVRGMETIGAKAKQVGGKIKEGLAAGFKGAGGDAWKGGKDALKEMTGSIKSAVGAAATLGGGIGFGMLIKKSSDLRAQMRDIEFSINKTGKATADWRDLMAGVQAAADETGQSSGDLGAALDYMFKEGGDADFAQKALVPIGHAAQASGKSLQEMAGIAVMLQEKFGATFETLPAMLAVVTQKTGTGGLALDAMGDKFGLLAGEAVDAGFAGSEGLASVLGMLNSLDDRLGEKSIPSFKKLFQTLKDGSASLKEIQKASGLKLTGMDGAHKLHAIMGNDKARKAVTEKLGGEQRVVFDLLSKPYVEAAAEAKKHGATAKQQTAAGVKAFDEAMRSMGDASLTYQDLLEHSKGKQEDDPQIKLNKAIEKISQKFAEPKMLGAIDRLAETLPRLADGMIKLLDFAMDHPLLAGGAVVGAKVGGGMIGGLTGKVGENVGGAVAGALKRGAAGLGTDIAADLSKTMAQGAPGWGKLIGSSLGVVAAAAIAYEVGKALIDSRIDEKNESQRKSIGTGIEGFNAVNSGDLAGAMAAKEKLEEQAAQQRQEMADSLTDGIFDGIASLVDSDYKSQGEQQLAQTYKDIAELSTSIAALTDKMNGAGKATDGMADATKKAGQAAGGAASAFFNVGGGVPTDTTGNGVTKGPGGVANKRTPGYFD